MSAPRFSICVPHYQPSIPHDTYRRGIASILGQTFQSFEILAYHDGPMVEEDWRHSVKPIPTKKRYADWGATLLDKGIKKAKGEFCVFFNPDNVLYPHALESINRALSAPPMYAGDNPDLCIMPIKMMGVMIRWLPDDKGEYKHMHTRSKGAPWYQILTGIPPMLFNIDRLQMVVRTSIMREHGGWWDKSERSDGAIFNKLAERYGYRSVSEVCGEHN